MSNIYVDVFPDGNTTSFDYYDDDGNSTSYENNSYFKQKLTVSKHNWKSIDFTTGLKEGSYNPDVENYIVKLHVKSTGAVTSLGKELDLYSNLDSLKNAPGEGYATGIDNYGDVIYIKVAAGELKTINASCVLPEQPAQTATIYAKNDGTSASFQYSVDGGDTWVSSNPLTQSDKIGYLKTTLTYALTNSDYVKVRYEDSTGYKPTKKGVELPNGKGTFTISKNGTVTTGIPVISSSKIYLQSSTNSEPILQFKDDTGNWSNVKLTALAGDATKFIGNVSYPADDTEPAVRYSENGGVTWNPTSNGQVISNGDYKNDNNGSILLGNPNWSNITTIYYKGYSSPYIHYKVNNGTWTTAPGIAMMETTEMSGYTHKITIDLGNATSLTACFNNGSGSWDSRNGANYIFNAGKYTYFNGTSVLIN